MKIAIIGRTEVLYETAVLVHEAGHKITCIVTAKEAPEYTRGRDDFKRLAHQLGVPFTTGARISAHNEVFRDNPSDIAVSMNFPTVIDQSAIDHFPLGILNVHGGDLPRYRGNACQAWAILQGESRIGLCVHKMEANSLDSGDIITRDYLPIDHTTKVTAAWRWLADRSPSLVLEAVNALEANSGFVLESQSTDPADALRCYPRRPEDGRIDWKASALDCLRLVNASNKPYAGAFCQLEDKRLIIWDAELVDDAEVFLAVPGQVTRIDNTGVEIACGDGKLRLKEVEVNGESGPPQTWIKSMRQRLK